MLNVLQYSRVGSAHSAYAPALVAVERLSLLERTSERIYKRHYSSVPLKSQLHTHHESDRIYYEPAFSLKLLDSETIRTHTRRLFSKAMLPSGLDTNSLEHFGKFV